MHESNELVVITKAKDLTSYILIITDKSPKKFRFTLVSRLQNKSLDVVENLYYANSIYIKKKSDLEKIKQRSEYQKKAYVTLKLLGYLALIAREQQCILPKQYEQISKQLGEVSKLLVSWAKSDRLRYQG